MTLFPQQWVMKKGIATSNERVHQIKSYLKIFDEDGFASARFALIDRKEKTIIPRLSIQDSSKTGREDGLVDLLKLGRSFIFDVCRYATPALIGKTELLLLAYKNKDVYTKL